MVASEGTGARVARIEQILSLAASGEFAQYRPQSIIDAVNALLPLGADGALDAIQSWLGNQDLQADPRPGLFLVLRVLFEVPADPGYHPPVHLGAAFPPPPPDPASLPLHPIMLVDDWPLMLVSGYALAGDIEPVSAHVQFFRTRDTLRARPLAPSNAKHSVVDHFIATWRRAYGSLPPRSEKDFIKTQLTA